MKLLLLILGSLVVFSSAQYEPNWESIDSRPLPEWYDKAKVGIFLHWGVFSVPSFGSEWFWYSWAGGSQGYKDFMSKSYPPNFTYQDFAKELTAEFYNPDEWAELFAKSGAKYVVLTSKHHEGYTLWPSKYSYSWNAKDVGPNRDIIGDLANSIRSKTDIHFGLYHSLYEWFNPLYQQDAANNYTTTEFVDYKILPEMRELINTYKPEVLWSDGDWDAPDTYWNSTEFLAWLYNESPVKDTVVTNDRWGRGIMCNHGGYLTCSDRYNPGHLLSRKWENAMTIDKESWGYRRNAKYNEIMTINELLETLVHTISYGGNILINVGPTKEGTIVPIFQERLLELGKWLSINGESIYETIPWIYQNDTLNPNVWYTTRNNDSVYAIFLEWPKSGVLSIKAPYELFKNGATASILGNDDIKLGINLSDDNIVNLILPRRETILSEWVWTVKIIPQSESVELISV